METTADLMLVTGVLARCCDCASDQILMPVDAAGEYCCTVCDAAVVLWDVAAMRGDTDTDTNPNANTRRLEVA